MTENAVKKMVEFTENLTLRMWEDKVYKDEYLLSNIDTLSEQIISSLHQLKGIQLKVSISIQSKILADIFVFFTEFLVQHSSFNQLIESGQLKSFIKLITQLEGFKHIEINKYKFNSTQLNSIEWRDLPLLTTQLLTHLKLAKCFTKELTINNCKLFGNDHQKIPLSYPQLKVLTINNCKISKNFQFPQFTFLEDLKVRNISISEIYLAGKCGYPQFNKTQIEMSPSDQLDNWLSLKILTCLSSIGTIPKCTIYDYETVFNFHWIYKFLLFASKQDCAKDYPPIILKISKFKDEVSKLQNGQVSQDLNEAILWLADLNNLIVISIPSKWNRVTVLQIKLQHRIGRAMTLYVDQSREGGIFEINGISYCQLWHENIEQRSNFVLKNPTDNQISNLNSI
ncbi:hypothetical protein FGO68_gene15571 [Halteria grandinella]|uniref:Uncharacterized protein n=1 Tax=Halteria grandinella TaxID=5974 RepID=A0A8J8T713_HALGN|nr:hypothetical protein FGO68_gene15571 [Halteria grandinella]